jgi:hypothetical protein
MKNDNETGKKSGALHLTKTTISNLTNVELNRVLGGFSIHSEPCNDWRTEITSGLPSCPDYPA